MLKLKSHIPSMIMLLIIASAASSCCHRMLHRNALPSVQSAQRYALSHLKKSLDEIPLGKFPIRTKGDSIWELTSSSAWTSGFYPGCLWLAYQLSGDPFWIDPAERYTDALKQEQFNTHTHDIGFMMLNSYGNGYKVNQSEAYKQILLQSANSLASRFNEKIGCIQSWDGDFQVIVDNMMNLEILFWAVKHGGRQDLYDIAVRHANTTMANHLREDGSTFHVVVYDTSNGQIRVKRTAQGFAAGSTWARGQAWGIYGFTVCFRETGDSTYLDTAVRMAEYYMDHLPEDWVPFWDFNLPSDHPRLYRDASSAAIALSALLELRGCVPNPVKYDKTIEQLMAALIKDYLSKGTNSSGILIHCAYNVNNDNPFDWDASTAWGDYYFLEALIRYKNVSGNPFR